jgi:hypothetical protein
MTNKQKILVSAAAILGLGVFTVAGLAGLNLVMAATTGSGYTDIVVNLAKKFNLNQADVAQVFQDTQTERISSRLDEAVTNKTITAAQKTLILQKRTEVQKQVEDINNQSLTAEARRTALQKVATDLRTWATANNIPANLTGLIMGGNGGGRGMGGPEMGGGMMGKGGWDR